MCIVEIHEMEIISINETMTKANSFPEPSLPCVPLDKGNEDSSWEQDCDKRIKANEDQDFCFCGGSEKSRFQWLHKEPF